MPSRESLSGKLIAITGAASGIGRALAIQAAQRGALLALSDRDAEGLAATAAATQGRTRVQQVVDVSSREAVFAFAEATTQACGPADVIINNAGVSVAQKIADLAPADLEWILSINFWGVVHGTQAFLPAMRERGSGTIVNLSSIFGVVAWPTQGAYSVTKFAVRAFTEALRGELMAEGSAVLPICVMPGGVSTAIVRNARYRLDGGTEESRGRLDARFQQHTHTTAEAAAQQILDAIEARRPNLVVGKDAKFLYLLQRLMPLGYQRLLNAALKRAAD